ncbi:MarR family winged helix-turn-helix transcriptional regulator [Planotetraspora kaengkrachanensis]|uniref:HTH marR-type domain-containing protein n=1 Tax=Planotetraspora kaengkrachanensis TaxID=575193 RepID=A0A8J3PSJ1_9ACTN|nr:MarR family winged helix-turn-helix transcriptional regulator [Planotetraspora kaengkrachanensis]GIG79504.1 hypothetical protein Pka01_26310 [Planotetraspora kaengkrachanensis]
MDLSTGRPPSLLGLSTYLLSLTGKAARAGLAERLAARGLRLWHMATLAALADFGPHAQRDLATRLAMDPSDVAKVVDELAVAGYVDRSRDPGDRRRVAVTLTDSGRTALAELDADARRVQDEILAPLSREDRLRLHTLLRKVYGGLGRS